MDGTSNRVGGGIYSPDRMILQKNVVLKNPKKFVEKDVPYACCRSNIIWVTNVFH